MSRAEAEGEAEQWRTEGLVVSGELEEGQNKISIRFWKCHSPSEDCGIFFGISMLYWYQRRM